MTHSEHRRHPRSFFPEQARISANFQHLDSDDGKDFPAIVMNMSDGGIGIATRTRFSGDLVQGQRLQLLFIKVGGSTSPLRNILTRVQWVIEDPMTDKLILGLEFRGLNAVTQGLVHRFLDSQKA